MRNDVFAPLVVRVASRVVASRLERGEHVATVKE
jgi:hypothetical protein